MLVVSLVILVLSLAGTNLKVLITGVNFKDVILDGAKYYKTLMPWGDSKMIVKLNQLQLVDYQNLHKILDQQIYIGVEWYVSCVGCLNKSCNVVTCTDIN